MQYRFNSKEHIHELQTSIDRDEWEPLHGTTSVINEVYPPPLAWYGSAKALEGLGFVSSKKEPNEMKRRELAEKAGSELACMLASDLWLDEYMALLEKCYKNHDTYKKEKGKAGKDMHSKIEGFIKTLIEDRGGRVEGLVYAEPDLQDFAEWALRDVDHFLWSEANCYSERLWAGGITDFGFVHKNGKTIIGDCKPSIYPKNFIQTAAYGIYLKEHGLFDEKGKKTMNALTVDGYCIFDYNKGEVRYLTGEWVAKLQADFEHTLKMYRQRSLIGEPTLQ